MSRLSRFRLNFSQGFKDGFGYAVRRMLKGFAVIGVILACFVIFSGLIFSISWLLTHGFLWIVVLAFLCLIAWWVGSDNL